MEQTQIAREWGGTLAGPAPDWLGNPVTRIAGSLGIDVTPGAFGVYSQGKLDRYQINLHASQMDGKTIVQSLGGDFKQTHADIHISPDVAARSLAELMTAVGTRSIREYVDIAEVLAKSALQEEEAGDMSDRRKKTLREVLDLAEPSQKNLAAYLDAVAAVKETELYRQFELATPENTALLKGRVGNDPDMQRIADMIEKAGGERQNRISVTKWAEKEKGASSRMIVLAVPRRERDLFSQGLNVIADQLEKREDVRSAIVLAAALQDIIPIDEQKKPVARVAMAYRGHREPLLQVCDVPEAESARYAQLLRRGGVDVTEEKEAGLTTFTLPVPPDSTNRRQMVDAFVHAFPHKQAKEDIAPQDTHVGWAASVRKEPVIEVSGSATQVDPPPPQARGGWLNWVRDMIKPKGASGDAPPRP